MHYPRIQIGGLVVANHLTPTELAEELNMKRREVISKCMEMGVPIFNGRIDRSLFVSNLRSLAKRSKGATAA
jgi:Translation initiation factor IF-2, N-terminal region